MAKKKISMDNISIEHQPDGPYAESHGLEWYYTFGDFDGWAPSEEAADEAITKYIKSQGEKK